LFLLFCDFPKSGFAKVSINIKKAFSVKIKFHQHHNVSPIIGDVVLIDSSKGGVL